MTPRLLLEATNRTFRDVRLGPGDVSSAWAGLRPLLAEEGKAPSEISRRDEIMEEVAEKTGLNVSQHEDEAPLV